MKLKVSAPSVLAALLTGLTAFTTQIEPTFFSFFGAPNAIEQWQPLDQHIDPARFIVSDDQERSTGVTAFDHPVPAPTPAAEPAEPAKIETFRKTIQVGRGDTLMGLMVKASITASEAHDAISALRPVYDPRSLRVGQDVTLLFDAPSRDARFVGLEIEPDAERTVTVARVDEANYRATQVEKLLRRQKISAQAVIRSSLIEAGTGAGVPMPIMIAAIRAFSYSVDFQRDIQPGDSFEILYERFVDESGAPARDGEMLFAGLTLSGKPLELFRLEMGEDTAEYYQPDGTSIKKALLRTPIDGARITSGFGMRSHPILGYSKMHKGMDFGAPTGTPVYAAGDGVVDEIGAWGSYGNYIRLRHTGAVSTAYAHLSRFAPNLKKGRRVRQGEVIAYVGTTGRSTGPHLHYEVIKGHAQVNPATVELPMARTLEGKQLASFKQLVEQRRREFQDGRGAVMIASAARGRGEPGCIAPLVC